MSDAKKIITDVYEKLIIEMKMRREQDSIESFETSETFDDSHPEVFVKDDLLIEKELASNKCRYETKSCDLFEKYASEDKLKNDESLLKGDVSEWEAGPVEDNEEFESLDVKEGDFDDDEEKDEDRSDEDLMIEGVSPIPDFTTPTSSQPSTQIKPSSSEANPSTSQVNGSSFALERSPSAPQLFSQSSLLVTPPSKTLTSSPSKALIKSRAKAKNRIP